MDPELKRLLDENLALARQNNSMLRAMRRDVWIGLIWKVVVWAVLIVLPLYAYQQYLAPIVKQFQGTGTGTGFSIFGLPSSAEIQKLLDSYQAK